MKLDRGSRLSFNTEDKWLLVLYSPTEILSVNVLTRSTSYRVSMNMHLGLEGFFLFVLNSKTVRMSGDG